MKAGTTFLFETLTKHPLVLNALVGVAFKETGCYLPSRLKPHIAHQRMSCFPFVRSGDPFIFGDGTTSYAGSVATPIALKQDNPNVKAVFVVRDPIQRLQSHHRFQYKALLAKGNADLNKAVLTNLGPTMAMNRLREAAVDLLGCLNLNKGSRGKNPNHDSSTVAAPVSAEASLKCENEENFLINLYHTGTTQLTGKFRQATYLLKSSIYVAAILYWRKILGEGNVLVVHSEDLRGSNKPDQMARVKNTLNNVHDFLGICRIKPPHAPRDDIHLTRKDLVPQEHMLANVSHVAVANFFEPFTELLDRYFPN